MQQVDLHTHSNISDGTDDPSLLVENAKRTGLSALALTDHDAIDGLEEAEEAGKRLGVEVVRGIELAVEGGAVMEEIHILGLWVPRDPAPLKELLQKAIASRDERNEKVIAALREQGLDISMAEVQEMTRQLSPRGMAVGRPHIAFALVKKGIVSDFPEAFARYLGDNGVAYARRKLVSPKEGIETMARAGMTVAIAHPRLHKKMSSTLSEETLSREFLDDLIADYKNWGMTGIEAFHSSHDNEDVRVCLELAAKHDLVVTGGSDYHGKTKRNIALGVGKGNMHLPFTILENLKEHRRKKGLPL